ncbi:helix-turn-helix domain-containing protein [Streptomyces sp. NBC_00481]|uniref:helix-turn-helix domain-containing protein n=1 Tax=Streptomyces sp. NBC_00481 TaxID=2975755 RepID=UPI002DD88B91|nr:helix-turn-helix domain-containing protein [Streptomyces sp. NBC_00481]WRY96529.1 helix-turn-helix domain-containing protein [Streptomyces sp. NBC_00481]
MAESKPSGAVRPQSRIRRSATRSGVTHVKEYQPDRYTIIGNHLAQHRELSLTAIGLGTHILSLPQGAAADIRTLAERFPEGRDRIAFALRELEAHGYVERVRERVDGGRVVTRTYAYNAPALTRARGVMGEREGSVAVAGPVDLVPVRPVVEEVPVEDVVADGEPVEGDLGAVDSVVPPAAEDADAESSERGERYDKAVALLVGLRRTDDRFTLSQKDVRRLAPAVVAWFDNGASGAAVHRAMTADLPVPLRNPARFLAYRLSELLPPPLPVLPEVSEGQAPEGEPEPWYRMVDCAGGCNRAFRRPEGTWCRDCRAERERRISGGAEARGVAGTAGAAGAAGWQDPNPSELPELCDPSDLSDPPVRPVPPVPPEPDSGRTDPPGFPRSAA